MSSNDIAISVKNLSKCYAIYDNPRDRLKQFVMPRLRRLLGRPPKSYYREFWALRDVSFEVKKGETVGIIGRNGSGKSTLLQMICGTLTPTSGSIQTNGRVAALLELGSGFNPEFTGRENVYMNAAVLGLTTDEIDARFDDIAAFADIGDFIEQSVKTYSSGMMVRLAFAVIAHVDADILVIDEALAVGDAFFTQKCMRFLRTFMKAGTVLFVSHDTGAVVNLCSTALWLHKGVTQLLGLAKEVTEKYLEKQYYDDQPFATQVTEIMPCETINEESVKIMFHDMRRNFINSTSLRNDIKIFKFNADTYSYGNRCGEITESHIEDIDGKALAWVVGGETVRLKIKVQLSIDVPNLLFGFSVKDRLGQNIFGDNSYLTFVDSPLYGANNEVWVATFTYQMPTLPIGEYSVDLTFGSGSQEKHVIYHWMRDAIIFNSHASSAHMGLIGIPMQNITAAPIKVSAKKSNKCSL